VRGVTQSGRIELVVSGKNLVIQTEECVGDRGFPVFSCSSAGTLRQSQSTSSFRSFSVRRMLPLNSSLTLRNHKPTALSIGLVNERHDTGIGANQILLGQGNHEIADVPSRLLAAQEWDEFDQINNSVALDHRKVVELVRPVAFDDLSEPFVSATFPEMLACARLR
jgi:hypothetical protein